MTDWNAKASEPPAHLALIPQLKLRGIPARIFNFWAIMRVSSVAVAQLVESQIVILVVVGSSPISHPTFNTQ